MCADMRPAEIDSPKEVRRVRGFARGAVDLGLYD